MTSPSLAAAVASSMPPDNGVRVGVVAQTRPLRVSLAGGLIPAGVLGSYGPSVGDTVALIRQDQTWLVLGTIGSAAADVAQSVTSRAKTSDLTRSSTTTLAADPDLIIPVVANATYAMWAYLIFTSGTTPDIKFDIGVPSDANWTANATTFQASGALGSQGNDTRVAFNVPFAVPGGGTTFATERTQITVFGEVATGDNGGEVSVRWSQNTSDAGATTLRNSSWFRLERIT